MFKRTRNRYEDKHLKHPAFFEKYFQKKPVWLTAALVIAILMSWGLSVAVSDLLGIKDDPDFDTFLDLAIIFGSLIMLYLGIDEYRFYSKELWNKKK